MTNSEQDIPAFPRPASIRPRGSASGDNIPHQNGMTLRDWFAGQALTGIATNQVKLPPPEYYEEIELRVNEAYDYADAMLEARNR